MACHLDNVTQSPPHHKFTSMVNKVKVTLGFGLYTDVNESPFLYTVFMFDQVSL